MRRSPLLLSGINRAVEHTKESLRSSAGAQGGGGGRGSGDTMEREEFRKETPSSL